MIQLLLSVIYLSFISLGLPDALLGAAWPSMYVQFGVPVSCAGVISMIVAVGTIVSSLQSDRLTRLLGAGKVTAISVAMTAAAIFGFSVSGSFWMLCLWAVPYGDFTPLLPCGDCPVCCVALPMLFHSIAIALPTEASRKRQQLWSL